MGRPSPECRYRLTSGKSPVRENCTPGSVGEVLGNWHLYPTTTLAPESCDAICEGGGEALTGERIGQPSSRESLIISDADVVEITEGNMGSAITRASAQSGVVEDPGMCGSSLRGNREISGLASGKTPRVRIGKTRSRSR